ncbi:MAG: 4Fe-4S binding protein [Spirochaetales bacterium]|nr:4Fe-4S binding protein [Spirochaetales bacterium]
MGKGRPEIDRERCKGCELCTVVCPESILRMSDQFNRKGYHYAECFDPDRCTACMSCAVICPDAAIRIWRRVTAPAGAGAGGGPRAGGKSNG